MENLREREKPRLAFCSTTWPRGTAVGSEPWVFELHLLTDLASAGCHLALTEENHGVTVLCKQDT